MNKFVIADLYLSYVNEFVTLEGFSEYYGISENLALDIIIEGKIVHEERIGNDNI